MSPEDAQPGVLLALAPAPAGEQPDQAAGRDERQRRGEDRQDRGDQRDALGVERSAPRRPRRPGARGCGRAGRWWRSSRAARTRAPPIRPGHQMSEWSASAPANSSAPMPAATMSSDGRRAGRSRRARPSPRWARTTTTSATTTASSHPVCSRNARSVPSKSMREVGGGERAGREGRAGTGGCRPRSRGRAGEDVENGVHGAVTRLR